MKSKEKIQVVGTFKVNTVDVNTGKVLDTYEEKNLVVNQGLNIIACFIGGNNTGTPEVAEIGFGEDIVAPAPNDVETARYGFTKAIDSFAYPSTGRIDIAWTLEASENNGMDISDFGLLCGDGRLFARRGHPGIAKTSSIRLEGIWTLQF